MPIYLTNPKPKGRKKKMARRTPPKGYGSWKSYMAHIRTFKTKGGEKTMAGKKHHKKKKAAKRLRGNPPSPVQRRPKRRHFRSNPPVSMRGFVPMLMEGVVDAGEIVVGKAAVRLVPSLFGWTRGTMMNLIAQSATAVVLGYAGHSWISRNAGKMLLAGGLASPIEDMIKSANIPMLSAALGEEMDYLAAYPEDLSAYPDLSSYPVLSGAESADEAEEILANY